MEQKTPSNVTETKNMDSLVPALKYILSFFITMLVTYVLCTLNDRSTAFSFTFAVTAGIMALLICHAIMSDDVPKVKHYYIWMAALLSFAAITLCYMGLGVYPFGEKSVMIIDMHHQYSSFFSLVREKITSFGSLSYSDSVGMGGGLIPLIAYYLCSPYNIIALIFPRAYLTEAIALIEVLKITSAGATFAIFCRGVFKKEDYGTVAASVAYALSAYFIAYSWDVMWLDCLVLLPLIVYGLEKVMKGESPLLYSITLGLAITTNYYIGYMVCIFMVLWFITRMLETGDQYGSLAAKQKALIWLKKIVRFAWTSAVGGMLSMWILIPTAISLRETSGAEDEFAREVTGNFDFWDIFSRTFYGMSPTERGDNLPNIYCSMLAVLMIALFLLCRRIRLRTRVCFGGLLGVLVVLMANNWTNFAFHGFHFPNDLPYRNSFLVSFVMLAIAVQALDQIKEIDRETVFKAFAVVAGMLVIEQKIGNSGYTSVWTALGLLALYTLIIGCAPLFKSIKRNTAVALILAVTFVEMSTNAVLMIEQLNDNEVFTERESFVYDYNINKAAVSYVEEINTDGSRMEILPRKTCNDDALYDYSGLTVFASSNAKATTTLMGKLGYAINGVNSYIYNSYVPLIDSILNLKYVAFNHDIGTHAQLTFIDSVTDGDGNYRYIYQNTMALARGFTVDSDIIYWNSGTGKYENPFEVQNKFVEYAANAVPVYTMLNPTVESEDGMTVEFNGSYFYADAAGGTGSFTAVVVKEKETQTYVYVDCRAASGISVSVDNSNWSVTPYEPYIIDLGKLAVGDEVRINLTSDSTCSGNIFVAELDADALNNAISALGQDQLSVTQIRDGYIKGSISASRECVMFTSIPYNDGWTVTVDGKTVETIAIGDALLGIPLTEGTHQVEMKYHTDGFPLGITLTLLGIILLVLWALRKKTVYPLLKEYVPVLYQSIGEVQTPAPENTPYSFDELFAADHDNAVNILKTDSGEISFAADTAQEGKTSGETANAKGAKEIKKPQAAHSEKADAKEKIEEIHEVTEIEEIGETQTAAAVFEPEIKFESPEKSKQGAKSAAKKPQKKAKPKAQPPKAEPPAATGEVFEITEDNKNPKK